MLLTKRKLVHTTLAVALALAIAGCSKKEEPAPKATESVKAEALKVGFIYVGPVGDAGWTFAHDNGRKHIESKFGDKIKTTFLQRFLLVQEHFRSTGAQYRQTVQILLCRLLSL